MTNTFRRELLNLEGLIQEVLLAAELGEAPLNIVFHCVSGKNRSPVGLAAAFAVALVVAVVRSSRSSSCSSNS